MTDQPEGNHYNKYDSANPIVRRMMAGFLRCFDELVSLSGARTAYEVGCGEGKLSLRLAGQGLEVTASDISAKLVAAANELAAVAAVPARFECRSIYDLTGDRARQLVVCCEVMEHLEDPHTALEILTKVANPYLLVSVPREPLWRFLNVLRGAYLRDFGNTPGHIQHWSAKAFMRMLGTRFEIIALRKPTPWVMALCKTRTE